MSSGPMLVFLQGQEQKRAEVNARNSFHIVSKQLLLVAGSHTFTGLEHLHCSDFSPLIDREQMNVEQCLSAICAHISRRISWFMHGNHENIMD